MGLLLKAGGLNPELPDDQLESLVMIGMRGPILDEVQAIIMDCVFSPKITKEVYEDLGFETIPKLFFQIYLFQVGDSEKKSDKQDDLSSTPTQK